MRRTSSHSCQRAFRGEVLNLVQKNAKDRRFSRMLEGMGDYDVS